MVQEDLKNYNITFSINRPYLLLCCVTIYSLLKNNQKNCFFSIYILHNNCISENDIDCAIKNHPLNQFNNFKIILVDISHLQDLQGLSTIRHWTKEIYFKLFTPMLLPNVDTIMHLDTDVLVVNNIEKLLNTNMDNYLFAGGYDHKGWLNAGVSILNLRKIREENIQPRIISLLKTNITEESVIDKIGGRLEITNDLYTISTRTPIPKNINIIHFVARKPWLGFSSRAKHSFYFNKIYLEYLKEFIQNKYKFRFKLLTFYILSLSSLVRTIQKAINKKRDLSYKKNYMSLNKIYKYSTFK